MSRGRDTGAIHKLEDAAAWLEGLLDVEKRPDWPYRRLSLAPVRALLDRLGSPECELPILHIAGSKGKGSTALLAERVLRAAGRRVGTFTSPHLERWTERFRIDGREVDPELLARTVDRVRPHVEALRGSTAEIAPTFFDATTATALLLFREAGLDCSVLEVGLGGRLDSTNAVLPAVTCVTSIELEHTDRLGDTLAAIAAEKAGILKPGVPAVLGPLAPEALAVVERRAVELGAPVSRFSREISCEVLEEDLSGMRVRLGDGPLQLEARLPLLGAHQAVNAALALACARRLLGDALPPAELSRAARAGLAEAALPGRIEVLGRRPWVLVDAAHTAASSAALARVLVRLERPVHLVVSISMDKDLGAVLDQLLPLARMVTLTRAEPARSLDPREIAAAARRRAPDVALRIVPNPHLAVRAAREDLPADRVLCVMGSVYLAGIARRVLRASVEPGRVAVTRGGRRGPLAGA